VRRVIGALGRSFITVGILILLFVAYQLWGTGLYTSREQDRLRTDFQNEVANRGTTPTSTGGSTTSTTAVAPTTTTTAPVPLAPRPNEGDALAQIIIPRIGVDKIVVQGTSREDLRKGPGHYPDTPFPGQQGNAAIAGHRTTYGAPFGNLDQLEVGDRIIVRTVQGTFSYKVYDANHVVDPTDVSVLDVDPNRAAVLTLTTCNPKYSARQRLVVRAQLEETPLPASRVAHHAPKLEEGLSGEASSKVPTLIAGIIAAIVGGLWWLVYHRHPRWTNWLIGVIPFAVALFFFYAFLERVLPSNY